MKIKGGKYHREATFDRASVNAENRTVELSFSSEDPYERYFGFEILDHGPKAVRLKRLKMNGPLLMNHDSRDQIGKIERVEIGEDRKGRATVRFGKSARAEEVFQDVLDGIRGNVSVGYMIHKMKHEEVNKGAPDVFRAVDWEPLEISLVSVPADITVGVGKDNQGDHEIEVVDNGKDDEMLIGKKNLKKFDADKGGDAGGGTPAPAAPIPAPVVDIQKERMDARKSEQERIREITALGKKFQVDTLAQEFINQEKTVDEFKGAILEAMGAKPVVDPNPAIGLSKKETAQFSLLRALNSMAETGNMSLAPFEKEVSDAVEKKTRRTRDNPGFYIPWEVQNKRDLSVDVDSAGGYLVGTNLMSMIELLRNSMMVAAMGAQVLDGLVGDLLFPKLTGGGTAYWLGEGVDPTESQQVIGQQAMRPKTVGAYTDISRKLLIQSSGDVENMVRMDLSTIIALAMDLAAISGDGVSEPLGILNTTGIGSVVGGTNGLAPTWAHMVNLEKEVAKDNVRWQNMGYLTNSDMVGKLKQTQKGTNLPFIMTGPNGSEGLMEVNGYKAGVSNQVTNAGIKGSGTDLSTILFGNWVDLIIGNWGTLDIQVDPFTGGLSGTVRVRILRDTDIMVRHAQAFSAMTDAITA